MITMTRQEKRRQWGPSIIDSHPMTLSFFCTKIEKENQRDKRPKVYVYAKGFNCEHPSSWGTWKNVMLSKIHEAFGD